MVKLIKSERDYQETLARIDELIDAEEGTPEADELEVLATLAEIYEKTAFPIDLPDPVEAIKFRMDQMEMRQADLIPFIGSRSRVSDTALVFGNALVSGEAWVFENARVAGNAQVFDNAQVFGNARVSGTARVYGDALADEIRAENDREKQKDE